MVGSGFHGTLHSASCSRFLALHNSWAGHAARQVDSPLAILLRWRDEVWWSFKRATITSHHFDPFRRRVSGFIRPFDASLCLEISPEWKDLARDRDIWRASFLAFRAAVIFRLPQRLSRFPM